MKKILTMILFITILGSPVYSSDWCRWGNIPEGNEHYDLLKVWAYKCYDMKLDMIIEPEISIMESGKYDKYSPFDNRYWSKNILFWSMDYFSDDEWLRCVIPMDNYYDNITYEWVEYENTFISLFK